MTVCSSDPRAKKNKTVLLAIVLFAGLVIIYSNSALVDGDDAAQTSKSNNDGKVVQYENDLWEIVRGRYEDEVKAGMSFGPPVDRPLLVNGYLTLKGELIETANNPGIYKLTVDGNPLLKSSVSMTGHLCSVAEAESAWEKSWEVWRDSNYTKCAVRCYHASVLSLPPDLGDNIEKLHLKPTMLWYWRPLMLGEISLQSLPATQVFGSTEKGCLLELLYSDNEFTVALECVDERKRPSCGAISHLVWWRLGDIAGVSLRPGSSDIMMLLPGSEFSIENLRCEVLALSESEIRLKASPLSWDARFESKAKK